jgi:hypothetical protein
MSGLVNSEIILLPDNAGQLVLVDSSLIPTRGNLFLPVRLLVWADGRETGRQTVQLGQNFKGTEVTAAKKYNKNTTGSSTGRCLFVV